MQAYRHILLAMDFADECAEVANKAHELALQSNAELSVVHVLDNIAMPDTGYGFSISLQNDSDYPELEEEKTHYRELLTRFGIDAQQIWLIWGSPYREIVALAEKLDVDLIVMGSHGRHGLDLLLGSTANAVLHHAVCDVIAVKISENH